VENKSGVLARVVGLFSARGYNIDSLTVNKTHMSDVSVITIVVNGDDRIIEQVKKQLNKLIDVIKVSDHSQTRSIQRELAMVKVNTTPAKRVEIFQIAQTFHAEIVDLTQKSITLEIVGEPSKVENFIEIVRPYGIQELIQTGLISFSREGNE
ncbi:MAG TPA: acetolactate synthase small subunit, partial [Spirochaetota bacterium]|nr:acetolactate synthase small subunit [Spirochaetota bacterium]